MGACEPVAEADELVLLDFVLDACRRTNVDDTVDGSAVNALFPKYQCLPLLTYSVFDVD